MSIILAFVAIWVGLAILTGLWMLRDTMRWQKAQCACGRPTPGIVHGPHCCAPKREML
jgi:hypothetical protein